MCSSSLATSSSPWPSVPKPDHRKECHGVQANSSAKVRNGPTTWQADAIIDAKGIFTVPDILGNALAASPSATSNGFNIAQGFFWRESEVKVTLAGRHGPGL